MFLNTIIYRELFNHLQMITQGSKTVEEYQKELKETGNQQIICTGIYKKGIDPLNRWEHTP